MNEKIAGAIVIRDRDLANGVELVFVVNKAIHAMDALGPLDLVTIMVVFYQVILYTLQDKFLMAHIHYTVRNYLNFDSIILSIDISMLTPRSKGRSLDQEKGILNFKILDFQIIICSISTVTTKILRTFRIIDIRRNSSEAETPESEANTPKGLAEEVSANETNLWKEILKHQSLLQMLIEKRMENKASTE